MAKNLVGTLIGKGMTSAQIQERIKDFPTDPTTEYFTKLGYTKSTAKSYICKLRKNNLSNQEKEQKNISSKNEKTTRRGCFICSKNANKDNLILDTCALQNRDTIKIIDESAKVTVLLSTLNEMEDLKRKKTNLTGRETFLQTMISKFGRKFLKETKKYRLVPFNEDGYNDNSILKYLMQQPLTERQTIITADVLFANRAKCLGLEYILYDTEEGLEYTQTEKEELIQEPKTRKIVSKATKTNPKKPIIEKKYNSQIKNEREEKDNEFYDLGIRITFQKEKISIRKFNYHAEVFFVKGEECICVTENAVEVEKDVDYIVVVTRVKKFGYVKVIKEMVRNQKLEKEEYEYYNINEIYKSEGELHEDILRCCKNLLC